MIKFKQISYNVTSLDRDNKDIKFICVHDTGNRNKGANAEMHYRYFNGGNRNASADFFVDDKQILQINNYNKHYSWAVGDGKGAYGITNKNSVSVEMCIAADIDYNKMFDNTVQLVKYLMDKLKISPNNVVRHYDASKKNCPGTMSANGWRNWNSFKKRIGDSVSQENLYETWSVKTIQMKLNQVYSYKLTEDGTMGKKTMDAILDFQHRYGLKADGIVGPKTKDKIDEVIKKIKEG